MKKLSILLTALLLVSPLWSKDKLKVVTSILPQKFLVDEIGGRYVSTSSIVGKGESPATYQPKPSQIMKLGSADVLFILGVPYENGFIHKIEESVPKLKVVDSSINIEKREIEAHHHDDEHHDDEHHDDEHHDDEHHDDDHHDDEHHDDEHHDDEHHDDEHHDDEHHDDEHHDDEHHDDEHHHDGDDPHTWLNPLMMISHGEVILNELVKLDPENEDNFKNNFKKLKAELEKVDNQLSKKLKPYKGKIVFVYHPSFGYFTDRYGLTQESIENEGKEPTPKQLQSIITEAREEGIKTIIVQPEFSRKSADAIAKAIDGKVVILNPLEYNYISNIKKLGDKIDKSLE